MLSDIIAVFNTNSIRLLKDSNMKNLKIIFLILCTQLIFLKSVQAELIQTTFNTMFNKIAAIDKNQEVPKRVFKKFTPYKVVVSNSGQSEAELKYADVIAILPDGKEITPSNENDVFKAAKISVLKRSLIFGIPAAALTLGFLAVPVIGTVSALAIDENSAFNKQLDAVYFEKVVLKPNEEKAFYIFIPNKTDDIKDVYIKQN